jgi:hypothetical protein
MNKCAACTFKAAQMIDGLAFLLNAYCAERISAAHKAVLTADLYRAMDAVQHANAEFCQGVREEAQQHTRSQPQ